MSNDEKMIRVRKRFLWWPMSAGLVGFRWLQTVWIRERFAPGPGAAYHEGHYGEWKAICFASPPIEVKACELALPERRYIVTWVDIQEKSGIPKVGSLLICVSVKHAQVQPGRREVVCQYADYKALDGEKAEENSREPECLSPDTIRLAKLVQYMYPEAPMPPILEAIRAEKRTQRKEPSDATSTNPA